MRRSLSLYFSFLVTALGLFGVAAGLTWIGVTPGWSEIARFVALALGVVSGVATWYAAVLMASRHRVAWPLLFTMSLIVIAGGTFAVSCFQAPPPRL